MACLTPRVSVRSQRRLSTPLPGLGICPPAHTLRGCGLCGSALAGTLRAAVASDMAVANRFATAPTRLMASLSLCRGWGLPTLAPRFLVLVGSAEWNRQSYLLEITMSIRIYKVLPLLFISAFAFSMGACNTMRGVGEDAESAGKSIQKKADRHDAKERREERREADGDDRR